MHWWFIQHGYFLYVDSFGCYLVVLDLARNNDATNQQHKQWAMVVNLICMQPALLMLDGVGFCCGTRCLQPGIDKRYITVGSWYRSVYRMMVWNDCGVRRASACEIRVPVR